jgi:hypothetical protein
MWKRLVVPLSLVLLLSVAVFAVLYARATPTNRATLQIEAAKAMLQVIAAVLIGNIVLAIIRDYEDRRKAWQSRRDLLRADLTEGLLKLYSRAKAARRRLRANVNYDKRGIETHKYEDLLQRISDVQLGLERYKREAKGGESAGFLPESVSSSLESMEKYLGRLVTEYESSLGAAGTSISLANLPQLTDFIAHGGTEFYNRFVQPYHAAAKTVAQELGKDLPRRAKAS